MEINKRKCSTPNSITVPWPPAASPDDLPSSPALLNVHAVNRLPPRAERVHLGLGLSGAGKAVDCHEALGHDAELSRLKAETPDEAGGSPVGRADERGGGRAADVSAGRDGTSSVLTVIA